MRFLYVMMMMCCSVMSFSLSFNDLPFLKGRWSVKKDDTAYFQFKDDCIYAIKKNAKLSMDIKKIQHNENDIHLEMNNLKMHTIPLVFNGFDFKIASMIRSVMKHGALLKFKTLSKEMVIVTWYIQHQDTNEILYTGELQLMNIED